MRKIRLTGGEPLVRRGLTDLARTIGRHIDTGALDELTLTTNGTRLAEHAAALVDAGVRRVNVSLDSRDPDRFRHITRTGDVHEVLGGIAAAQAAGLAIKINMVALRDLNEDEIAPMLRWCGDEGLRPDADRDDAARRDRRGPHRPLSAARWRRAAIWSSASPCCPTTHRTGGPARYVRVAETGRRIGFITPLTQNFCEGCNRVRANRGGTPLHVPGP